MVAVAGDKVNCEASIPPIVIPVIDRLPLPVFAIVNTFRENLPTFVVSNFSDEVDRLIDGLRVAPLAPVELTRRIR
jgi:hypothetical protein